MSAICSMNNLRVQDNEQHCEQHDDYSLYIQKFASLHGDGRGATGHLSHMSRCKTLERKMHARDAYSVDL